MVMVEELTFEQACELVREAYEDLHMAQSFLSEVLCDMPDADEEDLQWSEFLKNELGYSEESARKSVARMEQHCDETLAFVIKKGVWF